MIQFNFSVILTQRTRYFNVWTGPSVPTINCMIANFWRQVSVRKLSGSGRPRTFGKYWTCMGECGRKSRNVNQLYFGTNWATKKVYPENFVHITHVFIQTPASARSSSLIMLLRYSKKYPFKWVCQQQDMGYGKSKSSSSTRAATHSNVLLGTAYRPKRKAIFLQKCSRCSVTINVVH